jgi:hypothetical protein
MRGEEERMATFPFTFRHAGRTFSVVSDGAADEAATARACSSAPDVYVRIVGIRGLHEFGRAEPGESNGRLTERIRQWYDDTYVVPGRPDMPRGAPT